MNYHYDSLTYHWFPFVIISKDFNPMAVWKPVYPDLGVTMTANGHRKEGPKGPLFYMFL